MELAEEYRLSVYQDLGKLADKEQVHIVRNEVTGQICVRKSVALEQAGIYEFLQTNQSPYLPVIYECIRKDAKVNIKMQVLDKMKISKVNSTVRLCGGINSRISRVYSFTH